ncbi:MAG: oligosaccharide flippase family protein, partial [Opitutales bacterium]
MSERHDEEHSARLHRGSIRGLLVSFGGQGLRLVISAGQIVVLSRLLAPELFGLFGMTWAVLALLYNCKDMGLASAVVQYEGGEDAFVDSAFWLSLFGGLSIATLVVVAGPLMAYVYGQPMVSEICLKLAPMFAIGGVTSHYQAIMRRRMEYVRLNVVMTIAQAVGTGGAVVLAMQGRGIDALVFQTLGQELTCLVLQPFFCPWRPKSFSFKAGFPELMSFGGNLSVFRLAQNIASTMDHFSLG